VCETNGAQLKKNMYGKFITIRELKEKTVRHAQV
jgi:hypothetical protein